MVVSSGLKDRGDLAWWAPQEGAAGGRPWLPWALRLSTRPQEWRVSAEQADSVEELPPAQDAPAAVSAVYELTALVSHVRDETAPDRDSAAEPDEGHLLAHIKVGVLSP